MLKSDILNNEVLCDNPNVYKFIQIHENKEDKYVYFGKTILMCLIFNSQHRYKKQQETREQKISTCHYKTQNKRCVT